MRAQIALLIPRPGTRSQNLKTLAHFMLQVFHSLHITIIFLTYVKTKYLQLSIIHHMIYTDSKKEAKKVVSKLILTPVTNTAF